jgi:predicted Zn-dependent peptidase
MASVAVGLWVGVGGRFEPAPLNGVSHFIEHMLFKGTRRRSARAIAQAVEGIGGSLDAFTGEENTCFFARAEHTRFEAVLEVLMDMFLHSAFASDDIEKERGVIKEEVAMYEDQPQHEVQELLNAMQWPDHPLGRPITGTARTVDALSREQILEFKRANYCASAMVLAVAGRVRHAETLRVVRRHARGLPVGARPRLQPVEVRQTQPRVRLRSRATTQTQLALGLRTCSRHDERRFPLRLLNVMLGENTSSRLFQVLREETGLAYAIQSHLDGFEDVGDLVVSAGLDAERLPRALGLILRALRQCTQTAPTARELREARDYVIGQMELNLESTEAQMMWLGEELLSYSKLITPAEIKQHLCAVTPTAIRRAAQDFFRPDRLNLAIVSPLKSPRGLEPLLKL